MDSRNNNPYNKNRNLNTQFITHKIEKNPINSNSIQSDASKF
jgi:hypothetical protein